MLWSVVEARAHRTALSICSVAPYLRWGFRVIARGIAIHLEQPDGASAADVHHDRAEGESRLEAPSAQGNLRLEQARHHEHIGGEAIPLDGQKKVRDSGAVQHLLGTDDVRTLLSHPGSASPLPPAHVGTMQPLVL